MANRTFQSPLGLINITQSDDAITALGWGAGGDDDTALLRAAEAQVSAYFNDGSQDFDLPLAVTGSDTQRAVCAAMQAIPFGQTRTYGDIARDLGLPAQSIGQACGGNPLPVIIPCHRVLGANGLGGFSARGGVESKIWLLKHEGAASLLI